MNRIQTPQSHKQNMPEQPQKSLTKEKTSKDNVISDIRSNWQKLSGKLSMPLNE